MPANLVSSLPDLNECSMPLRVWMDTLGSGNLIGGGALEIGGQKTVLTMKTTATIPNPPRAGQKGTVVLLHFHFVWTGVT
jgi:hypothetical protein